MCGELANDRFEMLEHVDEISRYLSTKTTLTAKQAYGYLMDLINRLEDEHKPKEGEEW